VRSVVGDRKQIGVGSYCAKASPRAGDGIGWGILRLDVCGREARTPRNDALCLYRCETVSATGLVRDDGAKGDGYWPRFAAAHSTNG
jgi:hypothetical protein